jgi:hypothetical protein
MDPIFVVIHLHKFNAALTSRKKLNRLLKTYLTPNSELFIEQSEQRSRNNRFVLSEYFWLTIGVTLILLIELTKNPAASRAAPSKVNLHFEMEEFRANQPKVELVQTPQKIESESVTEKVAPTSGKTRTRKSVPLSQRTKSLADLKISEEFEQVQEDQIRTTTEKRISIY